MTALAGLVVLVLVVGFVCGWVARGGIEDYE
jgi:hypothetical protein